MSRKRKKRRKKGPHEPHMLHNPMKHIFAIDAHSMRNTLTQPHARRKAKPHISLLRRSALCVTKHAVSSGRPKNCTSFVLYFIWSFDAAGHNEQYKQQNLIFFMRFLSSRNIERKTNENTQLGARNE